MVQEGDLFREGHKASQVPPDALGCDEPSYQLAPCQPRVVWGCVNGDLSILVHLRSA